MYNLTFVIRLLQTFTNSVMIVCNVTNCLDEICNVTNKRILFLLG